MHLSDTISLLELFVASLALVFGVLALDNTLAGIGDGANLRREGLNGSKRRVAHWAARNEAAFVLLFVVFGLAASVQMFAPEPAVPVNRFAADTSKWLLVSLEAVFGGLSLWNRYDRRRLQADYRKEEGTVDDRHAVRDEGRDAGRDLVRDTARDAGRDAEIKAEIKADMDAEAELARDAARDTGRDEGRDLVRDPARDQARDLEHDARIEAVEEAEAEGGAS